MEVVIVVLVVVLAAILAFSRVRQALKATVTGVETKGSAFARVAEQEGKLIALKAVVEVKKAEAKAVHTALDEIDSILG